MSYFHCGNGYPDRCNGYRGPLDTYKCTNGRHDAPEQQLDRVRELARKAGSLTITSGNASRAYAALLGDLHAIVDREL